MRVYGVNKSPSSATSIYDSATLKMSYDAGSKYVRVEALKIKLELTGGVVKELIKIK